MKTPTIIAAAAAAVLGLSPAFAGDDPAPATPQAADADCRIAVIPAHEVRREREVHVPPVTKQVRVPTFETVKVPIFETRREPVYEEIEVPTYEEREVPVYRTERVPVYGEKEVTVYREVREPVTIEIWNPFACEDECLELWDTCEKVACGTKKVRAVVGHEERQVACGTRTERVQTGSETRRVVTCYREVREQVGEREERRRTGWTCETIVVAPAATHTETSVECVPAERVTVIPDGTVRDRPLDGTSRALTESEFRAVLADNRP